MSNPDPRRPRWRFRDGFPADVLAGIALLCLPALYAGLTWARYEFWDDPGWFMQVAARVAAGDVLYRDVCWIYGPLPVYALALLYRLLGTGVAAYALFGQGLAILASLLTYRAARFLLPVPLALLGTAAVFLGGQQYITTQWGGFFSYVYAYTGAVSLGGVLGLVCVVGLLSYCRADGRSVLWPLVAGAAAGGALLTKPEYALACAGTGVLVLGLRVLFVQHRREAVVALVVYSASALAVAGAGVGFLAYQAGGANVWAGVTGYGQTATLLQDIPPWGTLLSWAYIGGGLGVYLLLVVALLGTSVPALRSTRGRLLLAVLATLALALIALWELAFLSALGITTSLSSSSPVVEAARLLWSPGTLVLAGLLGTLGGRWTRAWRRDQALEQNEWSLTVLAVYSALLAARFYFNPIGDFAGQYVDTLFPVLVYALVSLLPWVVARWTPAPALRVRASVLMAAVLVAYATVGLALNVSRLARPSIDLATPRGLARVDSLDRPMNLVHVNALQYVDSHTEPGDPILILGHLLGLSDHYFLSGRQNLLRQDAIMPWMGSSPADVGEIVGRLEAQPPRLILVFGRLQGDEPLAVQTYMEHYAHLDPIWQHIRDRYQVRTVIGEGAWGYVVYEPREPAP